jgi:hypothetical protein
MFFLLFLLDDRRIWIRIRIRKAQKHIDPTDPDPQHWEKQKDSIKRLNEQGTMKGNGNLQKNCRQKRHEAQAVVQIFFTA